MHLTFEKRAIDFLGKIKKNARKCAKLISPKITLPKLFLEEIEQNKDILHKNVTKGQFSQCIFLCIFSDFSPKKSTAHFSKIKHLCNYYFWALGIGHQRI